jgi:hypothetical protein
MISPNTKPGTDVVAVIDVAPDKGLPGLKKGVVYTVAAIALCADKVDSAAILREHGEGVFFEPKPWWAFWRSPKRSTSGYALHCFRYLELAGLDALLTETRKVDA